MAQQPDSASSRASETDAPASAWKRVARFVGRHPIGVSQGVFFLLVGIVALQNLEPTPIDILFWSAPALPKLVLILLSMLVGGAAWELLRRSLRR